MSAHPVTVAVAVCTYRREDVLVATLRQVLAMTPAPDEVVVVDQTPEHEPATQAFLREESAAGRINWVRQDRPNLCAARNRAAQAVRADVVWFIDDDVLLGEHSAARHRDAYADPAVTAVTQQLADGTAWRDVDYLRGFNFSVRRDALIAAGGFDEQFVGSAINEESDFARRLLAAGRRIVTGPGVDVVHLRSPAGGCRVPGNFATPEWAKTVGHWIFAYRHLHGPAFRQEIGRALRGGPLRRENVTRPWRWPAAWWSAARAMAEGRRRARTGVVSPFTRPAKSS